MGMPEHPHNYAWNRYIGAVLFKFYSIEFHSIGDGRLSANELVQRQEYLDTTNAEKYSEYF